MSELLSVSDEFLMTEQRRLKVLQVLVGFLISAIALWFAFRSLDWGSVWKEVSSVKLWVTVPLVLMFIVHHIVRAYRWRYLLPEKIAPSIPVLFDSFLIGALFTYLLPLRVGEFVRPYVLSRRSSASFPVSFASVVLERFFDLSAVLLTFVWVLSQTEGLPGWVYKGAQALGILAVGILIFLILGVFFAGHIRQLVAACVRPLPGRIGATIEHLVGEVLSGAQVLKGPAALPMILALTVIVWLTCYLSFYLGLLLFPEIPASYPLAISVAVIVALAIAAPSAPGFLGVYQAGCIAGFELFHISREMAVAYAIVTHVLQYLMVFGGGGFGLLRQRIGFGELRQRLENAD
jgi:uncharacterized protein (TIRG00374 family)